MASHQHKAELFEVTERIFDIESAVTGLTQCLADHSTPIMLPQNANQLHEFFPDASGNYGSLLFFFESTPTPLQRYSKLAINSDASTHQLQSGAR